MHHIFYFFMVFGTHKLFYKALQVTALTTLNLTNPLLLLKSHYSDSHIANDSFLKRCKNRLLLISF